MDLIPSPSPSVKIQIMGLKFKGKTLMGTVNKFFALKVYWHHPAKFWPIISSKLFLPIIWIYRISANSFRGHYFFFEFNLMYCDLWWQYIQVRKSFKGGNYSRAEIIRGNTVYWIQSIFLNLLFFFKQNFWFKQDHCPLSGHLVVE